MKNNIIKTTVFFLAPFFWSGAVSAHDQGGSLGVSASATDFYQISCFDDGAGNPGRLDFDVSNESGSTAPLLSGQVINEDVSMNTTDHINGDGLAGPEIVITRPGESNTYLVIIDKSSTGKVNYSFQFHCQTLTGAHTGTEIQRIQNQ